MLFERQSGEADVTVATIKEVAEVLFLEGVD